MELKPLDPAAIPAAIEKAHRYRLLNEPTDAESICRDVLAVDAENQEALIILVLALCDQLEERLSSAFPQAKTLLPRIQDPYRRAYYEGILCERRAKAHLRHGGAGASAYDWLRQALEHFERAVAQRPAGNEESLLRFNTCVRLLRAHPELQPAPDPGETMLE